MTASIIAVAGTLLGTITAYLLQQRAADRRDRAARDDRRRRDHIAAVTALARALADHRRTMWVVMEARLTGASPDRVEAARTESHATRAAVTEPLVTLRLLTRSGPVHAAADAAAAAAYAMHHATDLDDLAARREAALAAYDAFIAAAASDLN